MISPVDPYQDEPRRLVYYMLTNSDNILIKYDSLQDDNNIFVCCDKTSYSDKYRCEQHCMYYINFRGKVVNNIIREPHIEISYETMSGPMRQAIEMNDEDKTLEIRAPHLSCGLYDICGCICPFVRYNNRVPVNFRITSIFNSL